MNSKLKPLLIVVACVTAVGLMPVEKVNAGCVPCWSDAAEVMQGVWGKFQPFITKLMTEMGDNTMRAVAESGAAVRAEGLKAAMASKAVDEGVAAYKQQQINIREQSVMNDAMQQPVTTCASLATAANLNAAALGGRARAGSNQASRAEWARSNTNSFQVLESTHKQSNDNYCTKEEMSLGICNTNGSGDFAGLAGADKDAVFLFQGANGSSSYKGVDKGNSRSPQSAAADSYINRVVNGLPPEQLKQKGAAYYSGSPQARAYIELERRYNAMLSASDFSLAQIKEYHNPIQGLGASTKMDSVPGLEPGSADMSQAEVVDRFIASKFSPTTVTNLASNPEPHIILRDIAQMSAFQLRMSLQAMQQGSRVEGLAAHQLALMTEQVLRPQLEAQRNAAANANAAKFR